MRVVKGVRWELSRIEEKAYYCPRTNPSIRNKRLCTLQWCLKKRTELCPNVAWKSSCLCIETTEDPCHNYRQIYSVGVYHYYCRWNISVGIWQSSKIFTAHATTAKRYSIGDYRWKYRRNDFVGNVLAGNYFFLPRFAVWRPSVVGFFISDRISDRMRNYRPSVLWQTYSIGEAVGKNVTDRLRALHRQN